MSRRDSFNLSKTIDEYKESKDKENALKKAKSYDKTSHMSKQCLYNQLTCEFEQFTPEEAQYAIDNLK